ncbi:MAG: GNAT family N-acetyltransferase [Thermodesulfobacteriota bacterium]
MPRSAELVVLGLDDLDRWRQDAGSGLDWSGLFAQPFWLRAWWESCGAGATPLCWGIRQGNQLLGLVALQRRGAVAAFAGSPDLCDYQDAVLVPGQEGSFCRALLGICRDQGLRALDFRGLRPDARLLAGLRLAAGETGWQLAVTAGEASWEIPLPGSWAAYLEGLASRDRHELRRKLRRLEAAGGFAYRQSSGPAVTDAEIASFLPLFVASRPDKAAFLTPARQAFFQAILAGGRQDGCLLMGWLERLGRPVAATLGFELSGTSYLYNNGYDPAYRDLSLGFVSKALAIRTSLERGMARYDLLKGSEPYKRRLGGRPVPLVRCRLTASSARR